MFLYLFLPVKAFQNNWAFWLEIVSYYIFIPRDEHSAHLIELIW